MNKFPLKKLINLAIKKPALAMLLIVVIALSQLVEFPMTGADSDTGMCEVNSVYDGDTMRVTCNGKKTKIRLYCIDTPEMEQRPWGTESRDFLRALTPANVTLKAYDTDRYGRLVAEVFVGSRNLNLAMVEHGQASVYSRYCKKQAYFDKQQQAQKNNIGIWSKPGLQQEPWNWRRQKHASK